MVRKRRRRSEMMSILDYRRKLKSRYPKGIKPTLTVMQKLIWDIDDIRFSGEVKTAKNRKYSIGYHADADSNILLPYKIDFSQNKKGGGDAYMHIGILASESRLDYYKKLYNLMDASQEDIIICVCEDILLEIAFITYFISHKGSSNTDASSKKIASSNEKTLLDCARSNIFGRSAVTSNIEVANDVWNEIFNVLPSKDIKNFSILNKGIHNIAKAQLEPRKDFHIIQQNILEGKCPLDEFIEHYKNYPVDFSPYFVIKMIKSRKCINILEYLKNNTSIIERAIVNYTFTTKFTCDDYVYLRQIYDEPELTAITYKFLRKKVKEYKQPIEAIKKQMGFVDECAI